MEKKLGIVIGQLQAQGELIQSLKDQLQQAQTEYLRMEGAKIMLEEIIADANKASTTENDSPKKAECLMNRK